MGAGCVPFLEPCCWLTSSSDSLSFRLNGGDRLREAMVGPLITVSSLGYPDGLMQTLPSEPPGGGRQVTR
jgi:hypothetical protein